MLVKENMYSVKPVPGMEPPKMLSKPPRLGGILASCFAHSHKKKHSTFVIHDSLTNVQDLALWCNGLYFLTFKGADLTLQYYELLEPSPGKWALAERLEEREVFRNANGQLV